MPIPRSLNRSKVRSSGPHNADTCTLTVKWSFMMMLDLGGHRNLIQRHGFNDDELAVELGLQALIDEEDFHPRQALLRLRSERKLVDEAFTDCDYPDLLEQNLEALGELLSLDTAEQRILGFCVLMQTDPTLNNAADQLGMLGFNRMLNILSVILDIPQLQLARYLSNDGQLVRAGLLEVATRSCAVTNLSSRLNIANSDLPGMMRFHREEPIDLFKYAFRLSPPGTLTLYNYEHLRQHVDIARAYLGKALAEGRPGVNILPYGPPGTGKTQLSRLLAKTLNTELYEIACTDSDGDLATASQRLCALSSAMGVLRSNKALLVLDEIEDIFNSHMPTGIGARTKAQKGWINRMLEENTLPCFWLSNSVESLDAAHIRRFDMVIELPNPPRTEREKIVRDCSANRLGNDLDEASVRRFDMKIHFGYLGQSQVQQLFAAHLLALKLKDPAHVAGLRLKTERQLTPGDFASVARRARFKPFANANDLAGALIAETRLKSAGQQRPIGFIH